MNNGTISASTNIPPKIKINPIKNLVPSDSFMNLSNLLRNLKCSAILFLLTLPSATVLVGFLKSRFNVRQTLSAQKDPILQIIVSTPVQHLLWVITDITVLSSDPHGKIPLQTLSRISSPLSLILATLECVYLFLLLFSCGVHLFQSSRTA